MSNSLFSSLMSLFSRTRSQPQGSDNGSNPPPATSAPPQQTQITTDAKAETQAEAKSNSAPLSVSDSHRIQIHKTKDKLAQSAVDSGGLPMRIDPKRPAFSKHTAISHNTDSQDLLDSTVMIVDDEFTTTEILQVFLEEAGYRHFITINESNRAIELLESETPDILLTDINMPNVTGFDILSAMRVHDELRHIPAIVLTSADDADTKLKALELGASDFLAKPVDPSELALRLRNTLAAKAYQDRLASHDTLTGLPNRHTFMERLNIALRRAERDNTIGAILHISLDRFKQVNDTLGHSVGDTILQEMSRRLQDSLRSSDSISTTDRRSTQLNLSRIGGDEFSILLPVVSRPMNAEQVARRILEAVGEPIQVEAHELFVTAAIGIALFPNDGDDIERLLKNVDIATNYAKQQGGNTSAFYSSDMNAKAVERLSLEGQLRKALERDEFRLYYQPKVEVKTGQILGAEALIRWQHPELGMVPPDQFITLAEDIGLIVPIGEWVLHTACQQLKTWQTQGLPPLCVAVNVASQQFRDHQLVRTLFRALARSGLAPQYLKLELTENAIMENARENIETLQKIKDTGVTLSVDDFGTGYSSLSYLEQFPLDELKIDRSFISRIQSQSNNAPIATAIIAMAHSLGLRVVAEGVETEQQLAFLRDRACDEYQGFLFSKPVPADDFAALLSSQHTALHSHLGLASP